LKQISLTGKKQNAKDIQELNEVKNKLRTLPIRQASIQTELDSKNAELKNSNLTKGEKAERLANYYWQLIL